jgi:hypothetical protein
MRGEEDRDCRAGGGAVKKGQSKRKVEKAFRSSTPTTGAPDASLERGSGPIFKAAGGAVARKRGGKVEGGFKKPHMGRAGRARGGGVGSDLKPLTSSDRPRKPKEREIMPDSEKTP